MSRLADAARTFDGVRFRHRGRSSRGLDCAGLVVVSYASLGVTLPDFRLYGPEPFRDGLVARATEALGPPVAGPPADGCVVLLRFLKNPHHVAIVGERDYGDQRTLTLIHACGTAGRVLEQRLTPDVAARITHVFWRPV